MKQTKSDISTDSCAQGFAAANNIVIQRSIAIGAVNDPMEHEADTMADKVMRMPETNFIQRKCAGCKDDEEKVQRKPLASFIQKMGDNSGMTASDSVTQQINSTKGSGNTLDSSTKSFMESRFGTDFSDVKVHTGDYAVQMSNEINAQAFTVGNDIYFNSNKYNPVSDSGKHLLAHELTHAIQQDSKVILKKIQMKLHDGHDLNGILQRQETPDAAPVVPVCPVTAITPYGPPDGPPVGNEGMNADTIAAMTCLQNAVTAAGGTMHVTTRFRSQAYQDHLVEVWDKVNAPAHPEAECAAVMQNYAAERATHFPMGAPARGVSNHTNGNAFDATVRLPATANLDTIKAGCNLTTPVAGEPWHFET